MARRPAAVDVWTLGYTAVSLAIIGVQGSFNSVLAPVVLLAAGVIALAAPLARCGGSAGGFLGEFYPVLLNLALYTEVGISNRTKSFSYDSLVQSWEELFFGTQPSLEWMRAWPFPWFSSVMHIAYLSYYLIVLGVPLALWISGRRQEARHCIMLMMATFYLCYTAFRLFPVAGPRYLFPFPDVPSISTPVVAFAHRLVAQGSAWGTAFPSSHVAVAFVNAAQAWRNWRFKGAWVGVLAMLLALGTVYGQFHYAVDAVAGVVVAAIVLGVSRLLEGKGGPESAPIQPQGSSSSSS